MQAKDVRTGDLLNLSALSKLYGYPYGEGSTYVEAVSFGLDPETGEYMAFDMAGTDFAVFLAPDDYIPDWNPTT